MHFNIKIIVSILFYCSVSATVSAQSVRLLSEGTKSSLRGLSVVNDRVVWVSGSNGMVGKSLDSGNTWKWITVKGFEKNDFRDIEAFDETTAIIMAVGEPAYMLRTADGGESWKVVFENNTKGMFLDAMEFWNEMSGIVVGDPINHKIYIARTFDGGITWMELPESNYPTVDFGESLFASSGTNVRKLNKKEAVFVTGGSKSRLFIRDQQLELPVTEGKESSGANSIAVKNKKTMIIAGGDYNDIDSTALNCFITRDAGQSFITPTEPPHGYRSCVEYLEKKNWVCCGLNGADFSKDDGITWKWISKDSYHVCRKAKDGKAVFFAGNKGRIGKLVRE